jgi:hypothetical protein
LSRCSGDTITLLLGRLVRTACASSAALLPVARASPLGWASLRPISSSALLEKSGEWWRRRQLEAKMYAARPRFPYRTVVPPSRLPRGRDLIWRHVARATGPANAPTTRATPCCTASLHPRRLRSRESWAAADAVGVAGARVTQEATVQRGRCVRRVAVPFADPHSGSSSRVGDRSNRRLRLGPRWTTSPRLELGAQRTNWKTSPIARPCNTQLPAALFRSLGFPRCRVSGRSRDHSCARVVQPACPADAVVDISRRCRVGVAGHR